jgi:hypothetical protein
MKIAFIDVVFEEYNQGCVYTPSLFYALAKRDLIDAGHECDILLIKKDDFFFNEQIREDFIMQLITNKYDLIGFSKIAYSFMFGFIYHIRKAVPNSKIIIGGVNALTDLHSDWDYLVQGAGRKAIFQLVRFLSGEVDISSVPNLFYKKDELIYHTEKLEKIDINRELSDFQPDYESIKFGSLRNKLFLIAPIIGSFGCLHNKPIKDNPYFNNIEINESFKNLHESAQKVLNSYLSRVGRGCSFCNICVDRDYTIFPKEEIVNKLVAQIRYTISNYNSIRAIFLVDEYPFNYLYDLIKEIVNQKISIDSFSFESRSDWLYRNKDIIEKTVRFLEKNHIKLSVGFIGIENFSQMELDIFNKEVSADINILILNELYKIKNKYPKTFYYNIEHIILFNPWTRLEDIEINLKILSKLGDEYDPCNNVFFTSMRIYRYTPFYYKAKKDKLLIDPDDLSTSPSKWKCKDKRVQTIRIRYYNYMLNILYKLKGTISYRIKQMNYLHKQVSIAKNKKIDEISRVKEEYILKVGKQCNNNCIYCGHLGYKAEKDYTTKELKSIINKAVKKGYTTVIFPCNSDIRKDFFELLSYAKQSGFKIILLTNGRIFSIRHNLDLLLHFNVNIFINLNSTSKDIHDKLTNTSNSFEQTSQAITYINKIRNYEGLNHREFYWSIYTILTKSNYSHLSELNDFINNSSCNEWIIKLIDDDNHCNYKELIITKYTSTNDIIKRLQQ